MSTSNVINNFKKDSINFLTHLPGFKVDTLLSVGLGWHIYNLPSAIYYWHNGGVEGYSSCVAMNIKTKNALIVLLDVSAFNKMSANIDALCFQLIKMVDSNAN